MDSEEESKRNNNAAIAPKESALLPEMAEERGVHGSFRKHESLLR
jgi:hypothetical protein